MSLKGKVWSAAIGVFGIVGTIVAVATFGSSCATDSEAHASRHATTDTKVETVVVDVETLEDTMRQFDSDSRETIRRIEDEAKEDRKIRHASDLATRQLITELFIQARP